jgi:hypothetical protein
MDNARAGESDLAILQPAACGSDAKLEGGRKNNPSIIVRVISEDFDATGRERFDMGHIPLIFDA